MVQYKYRSLCDQVNTDCPFCAADITKNFKMKTCLVLIAVAFAFVVCAYAESEADETYVDDFEGDAAAFFENDEIDEPVVKRGMCSRRVCGERAGRTSCEMHAYEC